MRYLFWLGKPAVIPDCEINQLRSALQKDYKAIKVENYRLGQIINIKKGPFKNQESGIINECECYNYLYGQNRGSSYV